MKVALKERLWAKGALCLWLVLFFSGCTTVASNKDMHRLRSDVGRLRRDFEENRRVQDQTLKELAEVKEKATLITQNQADLGAKLNQMATDMQVTQAKIEETGYQLGKVGQKMDNLSINLLRSQASPAQPTTLPESAERGQGESPSPASTSLAPASLPPTSLPPQPAPPPQPEALPPPPAQEEPLPPLPEMVTPRREEEPPAPVAPPPAKLSEAPMGEELIDHVKVYETAYQDYTKGNFQLARDAFEEYMRLFPNTDLADNAQYWIGECYYSEGNYDKAIEEFNKVQTLYPKGNKVPNALLKIGYCYLQKNEPQEAHKVFEKIIDLYPLSSEADQARKKIQRL